MEYFLDMDRQYNEYEGAAVVLLPVPYDGTSTFVKGADKGPQALIDASDSIELYDVEEDISIYRQGIHTAMPIIELATPQQMVRAVCERTRLYLRDHKLVGVLGGEHSVSCGAIQATAEYYDNLSVLQIDAHADLREDYHGSKYNHACVMRRAQAYARVVQVGIRSVAEEEQEYIVPENIFYAHKLHDDDLWMQAAIDRLSPNVYLTIDLDGFDPSVIPSTGTPLPGGLTWRQVNKLLTMLVAQRNVVGFDVVELCPNEAEKSSDVAAAVLVYRIIGKILKKRTGK